MSRVCRVRRLDRTHRMGRAPRPASASFDAMTRTLTLTFNLPLFGSAALGAMDNFSVSSGGFLFDNVLSGTADGKTATVVFSVPIGGPAGETASYTASPARLRGLCGTPVAAFEGVALS